MPMTRNACLVLALALAVVAPLPAQQNKTPAKKLYCWNENGSRVCSDTLPANAVDHARDEFSAASGLRTGEVERALTEDERNAAAVQAEQQKMDEAAAETRRRTDEAMLNSYPTEKDLRRVFEERTALLENSLTTANYNLTSLRDGLIQLLQQAGDRELAGQKINDELAANIHQRETDLRRQLQLQTSFQRQRLELDQDIADTLARYRAAKGIAPPGADEAPPPTSTQ
ncbi:hypothetical protein CSC70_02970 [Pseudoxanthomonas kalamensis DSM 18571]|uniref:hypothetical protein n=1 Tax=Pseudoxanthomonas kalamensis TaxID=289483 RepID=UPI0013910AB4|nr:hypothetical protein [Pseudoxanthomonas kalamensis]KAF1712494.1 hypothetical protein CSC70_02970 [Pseudoxanthomonas kalamensis DSM 18571]